MWNKTLKYLHARPRQTDRHTDRHTLKWFYICPMRCIALDRQNWRACTLTTSSAIGHRSCCTALDRHHPQTNAVTVETDRSQTLDKSEECNVGRKESRPESHGSVDCGGSIDTLVRSADDWWHVDTWLASPVTDSVIVDSDDLPVMLSAFSAHHN